MDEPLGSADDRAAALTEQIIDRFGGIRPMAAKLDTPVTTVQGWKKRGAIPAARHGDIVAAAAREGIAVGPAELVQTDPGGPVRPEARPEARMNDGAPERPVERPYERGPVNPSAALRAAPAIALLSLVLVIALAVAGWQVFIHPMQKRIAALEARIAAVEPGSNVVRRLDVLESEVAQRPQQSAAPAAGDAADRVTALEQQVAQLRAGSPAADQGEVAKRLSDLQIAAGGRELLAQSIRDIQSSTAATQGEVERLGDQLKSVGQRLDQVDSVLSQRRQQALREEAVVLAVGQLRTALRDSKPFAKEIASVRAITADDHEIAGVLDQLQPLADSGVSTSDDLRTDFSRLAREIVRSAVVGDGSNWWRQALYRVESVISIRRIGESVPGDKADAIVARAEAKLEEDDLQSAIDTLRALSGLPSEVAAPWIHDAEQRVAADRAESELTRLAISRVATGAGRAVATPSQDQPAQSGQPQQGAPPQQGTPQ